MHSDQVAHATVRRELAALAGAQLSFERYECSFQLMLVGFAPLSAPLPLARGVKNAQRSPREAKESPRGLRAPHEASRAAEEAPMSRQESV